MATKPWAIILVLLTTMVVSAAQLLWKLGSLRFTQDPMSYLANPPLLLGIFLYIIGAAMLILAFRGGELTVLYPIFATSYIWVSILSMIYLGEAMNAIKWFGVFFIFSGVSMIGYGSKK